MSERQYKRTPCAQCNVMTRTFETQVQWYEPRGPHAGWLYRSRLLCPPCRSSLRDLVLGPAGTEERSVAPTIKVIAPAPRRARHRKAQLSPWNRSSAS